MVLFLCWQWPRKPKPSERDGRKIKQCKCWAPFSALSVFLLFSQAVFPENCFSSRDEHSSRRHYKQWCSLALFGGQASIGAGEVTELDLCCSALFSVVWMNRASSLASWFCSRLSFPLGYWGKSRDSVWICLTSMWLEGINSAGLEETPSP